MTGLDVAGSVYFSLLYLQLESSFGYLAKDCLAVLSGKSALSWEKMRPENRYGQMTPSERVAFALSDEG